MIVSFQQKIQAKFNLLCMFGKLFRVKLSGQDIWDAYLAAFPQEHNPVFRDPESSTQNCNLCKNFIRRYGNIVAIDADNNITTMWDVDAPEEYAAAAATISAMIKKSVVENVFFETFAELNSLNYERCNKNNPTFRLGLAQNFKKYTAEEVAKFGRVNTKDVYTFNHLHLDLPAAFVDQSGKSVESIMGEYRDAKNVFQRAMETISLDTLMLVKDLINQGSLLDGQTHLYKIEQIIPLKVEYNALPADKRDNWCWNKSYKLPFAKFRNELIGVLCSELSEGKELNDACMAWNKRVDPANYMKASAPITARQIEEAKKFVQENGYEESFDRRLANMDDIKASEILHSNVGSGAVKSVSVFDNVKSTSTQHKRTEFDKVEEVSIDKFMSDILPGCTSVEAFLQNNHEGNMVSLTTANNPDSKPIFKWSNNYSWTFNGNLAGKSQIKEAVKSAGGKVDGVLRASMIWNESGSDTSDLDLWCEQPNGEKIGYSTGFRKDRGNVFSTCAGQLDVDNTNPGNKVGVENIYFESLNKLKNGKYIFWVNQYSARNSQGFKFEIEFDGELFQYEYKKRVGGNVAVAIVTFKDGVFSIEHQLPSESASKDIYGLETNKFHKVNLVCLSPNHWGENSVGNKHYFFMLEGAKTPTSVRSFHNENLTPDLLQHRKVMEVLATSAVVPSTTKQLSGLGYNSSVRDELVVKLSGSFRRIVKIKF
ncbi:MAG: hypothetical protein KA234_01145 [Saprospiraceae bacterium]|nr:hypothetical protein [Saprospiraceae bacterium]